MAKWICSCAGGRVLAKKSIEQFTSGCFGSRERSKALLIMEWLIGLCKWLLFSSLALKNVRPINSLWRLHLYLARLCHLCFGLGIHGQVLTADYSYHMTVQFSLSSWDRNWWGLKGSLDTHVSIGDCREVGVEVLSLIYTGKRWNLWVYGTENE